MQLYRAKLSEIIYELSATENNPWKGVLVNELKRRFHLPTNLTNIAMLVKSGLCNEKDQIKLKKLQTKLLAFQTSNYLDPKTENIISNSMFNTKLRSYQIEDLKLLLSHDFIALFNEPRTGKTPTILEWLRLKAIKKIIIICPKSLQDLVWNKEIAKWYSLPIINLLSVEQKLLSPKARIKLLDDFFSDATKEGVLVVSKDSFKKDYNSINFTNKDIAIACIIDEAHWLRNNKTRSNITLQSKAVMKLRKHVQYAALLTGTPIVNHNSDLFGQLRFLYPSHFDHYWNFVKYFWGIDYFKNPQKYFRDSKSSAMSDLQREFNQLVEPLFTRRLRKNVMSWLPEVERKRVELPMSKNEATNFSKWKQQYSKANYGSNQRLGLLQKLVMNSVLADGKKANKIKWIIDFVKNIEHNEQIIVFSNYSHKIIPFLESALHDAKISYQTIIGDSSIEQRTKIVDDFQNAKFQILISNIQVAKEGLTLSNAAYEIFLDRSFNLSDNIQAEARFLPTNKNEHDNKIIIDLISRNTVEQKIEQLLTMKEDITRFLREKGWDYFLHK